MRRARRAAGAALLAVLVPVTCVAGTGWLYAGRPDGRLSGPVVHDALPLDELAGHSGMPLVLFAAAWLGAGALLGVVARLTGVGRRSALAACTAGIAVILLAATTASLVAVRQISTAQALAAAARAPALYEAALLAAAGIALARSGERGRARGSTPRRLRLRPDAEARSLP